MQKKKRESAPNLTVNRKLFIYEPSESVVKMGFSVKLTEGKGIRKK